MSAYNATANRFDSACQKIVRLNCNTDHQIKYHRLLITHQKDARVSNLCKKKNLCEYAMYWVVRKVRADFEGKLKRRRFKF